MASQIIPAFGNFGTDTTHKGLGIFTAATAADATNGLCQAIMPTGGTFKRLRVRLASAPGAGNSWTLALAVNGVDSALSAVVSGTATEVTIVADVAVSAGDLVRYSTAKGGAPANIDFIAAIEFEPTTAGDYVYGFTGAAPWNSTSYSPLIYGQDCDGSTELYTAVCAGTITRMDINMADGVFPYNTTPGAGNSLTYAIEKNGVIQDGTAGTANTTIACAGSTNTGSATFSLSVSEGDLLRVRCVVVGSPGVRPPAGTLLFQATTQLFAQCGVGNTLSTTPAYAWVVGSRASGLGAGYQWSTTEADRQLLMSSPFTATGLIIGISASEVWTSTDAVTVTLRVNGVDTALTLTITNPTRAATVSGSVPIAAGDLLSFKATATNGRSPGVWSTLVGTSTVLTKHGCFVAGVNTTVTATRSAAFGLDGNTNTQPNPGELAVFGNFRVTGLITFALAALSSMLDGLGNTLGDLVYRGSSAWQRLAGNTTTTKKFLSQTGTGTASAAPAWSQVAGSDLAMSDVTTNDVSITQHGFAPKAPNDATKYLDGTGAWSVPAGGGGSGITQLTGDVAAGPGTGSQAATLAASGVTAGTYGDGTHVAQVTVDSKGRVTAASAVAITGGGGSGALVLLEQHTASGSASLDLTTAFTSAYDEYIIELVNLVNATNAVDLLLRVSTDGGSTFSTTGYEYVLVDQSTSNAGLGTLQATSANGVLLFTGIDNSQSYGTSGRITLYDPMNASLKKSMIFQVSSTLQAVARRYMSMGSGFWGSTTAVNAVRILFASGNITSGTVRVYGVAK